MNVLTRLLSILYPAAVWLGLLGLAVQADRQFQKNQSNSSVEEIVENVEPNSLR